MYQLVFGTQLLRVKNWLTAGEKRVKMENLKTLNFVGSVRCCNHPKMFMLKPKTQIMRASYFPITNIKLRELNDDEELQKKQR